LLQALNIADGEITDEGLRYLSRQKSLEILILDGAGITDTGLTYLEGLSSLKILNLRGTKVTEQGMEKLKEKIPPLQYQLR
jgi:internalin A